MQILNVSLLLCRICLDLTYSHLGRFYNIAAYYYRTRGDLLKATELVETSLQLAISTGNTQRQSQIWEQMAVLKWSYGDYSAAQGYAYEARRLAKICGHPFREASALRIESACWLYMGNYKQCISLSATGRNLLALCGMSGGTKDRELVSCIAQVHQLKSEYAEAIKIQSEMLRDISIVQNPSPYALALLNIAQMDLESGAPRHTVQRDIDMARTLVTAAGHMKLIIACDGIQGALDMREGNLLAAKELFQKCVAAGNNESTTYCLSRLADTCHWSGIELPSTWTTVFLGYSLKAKQKLEIYQALQFLGDVFLASTDHDTAVNLFTVALDGFTQMDVHRSRAECMVRLGDIAKLEGDMMKAVELWKTAGPLFERSSQAKQAANIEDRLCTLSPEEPAETGEMIGMETQITDDDAKLVVLEN
jgi:tetratricopeptide (TPR) repeat protein